jgi:hypothetical protein
VRLKRFGRGTLSFGGFRPRIANAPEQHRIVCRLTRSRSKSLIYQVKAEARITGKPALSPSNNAP